MSIYPDTSLTRWFWVVTIWVNKSKTCIWRIKSEMCWYSVSVCPIGWIVLSVNYLRGNPSTQTLFITWRSGTLVRDGIVVVCLWGGDIWEILGREVTTGFGCLKEYLRIFADQSFEILSETHYEYTVCRPGCILFWCDHCHTNSLVVHVFQMLHY